MPRRAALSQGLLHRPALSAFEPGARPGTHLGRSVGQREHAEIPSSGLSRQTETLADHRARPHGSCVPRASEDHPRSVQKPPPVLGSRATRRGGRLQVPPPDVTRLDPAQLRQLSTERPRVGDTAAPPDNRPSELMEGLLSVQALDGPKVRGMAGPPARRAGPRTTRGHVQPRSRRRHESRSGKMNVE